MKDIFAGIAERFISKKLAAFLLSIFAAYFSVQHLDLERADKFLQFLTWITNGYLLSQGGVDTVAAIKKSVGLK